MRGSMEYGPYHWSGRHQKCTIALLLVALGESLCEAFVTSASIGLGFGASLSNCEVDVKASMAFGGARNRDWISKMRSRSTGISGSAFLQRIAASGQSQRWERPPNKGKRDVVIGTKVNTATPTANVKHDEGFGLSSYMQLPPEQYALIPLPNKAKLERISGRNFRLNVPELQFLNVWVRPVMEATIDVAEEGVDIKIIACRLDGSPEVEKLGINNMFDFDISVFLSCNEDPRGLKSILMATSLINVWVDPPAIFRAMFPKPLMEHTGNAVIGTTLNIMQSAFVKGLADDYGRWARDAAYREKRAGAQVVG